MTIWTVLAWIQDTVPVILIAWMIVNLVGVRDAFVLVSMSIKKRRSAINGSGPWNSPRNRWAVSTQRVDQSRPRRMVLNVS